MKPEPFNFQDIERCSEEGAGIYAWYWIPELSPVNIEREEGKPDNGAAYFQKRLFGPMSRPSYNVRLSGKLVPPYRGEVKEDKRATSKRIVQQFAQFPSTLRFMSSLLGRVSPIFTAPLYVGVASNLRRRIGDHKKLLLDLSTSGVADADRSFAEQVMRAGIDLDELRVYCLPVEDLRDLWTEEELVEIEQSGNKKDCLFGEYVLNRWAYPVFGAN